MTYRPRVTYRLSGHQGKEVVSRGQVLWIAIPRPLDLPDGVDLLAFARASLPTPGGEIASAEEMELGVEPGRGPGLTGVLGSIQARPSGLHHTVVAIVIEIRPARVQGESKKIQWPGTAHAENGFVWPRKDDDAS